MMFEKSPAKAYHAAVAKLQKAEVEYSKALEELTAALDQRRAHDVPGLRRRAKTAEDELRTALESCTGHWRSYWLNRRAEVEPQLKEMATTLRRYDAFCKVLGGLQPARPASLFIDNAYTESKPLEKDALLDDAGVPADAPDSELLTELSGAWK